jgi:hypothetical protein
MVGLNGFEMQQVFVTIGQFDATSLSQSISMYKYIHLFVLGF